MQELKIFNNPEFGEIRTVTINDEPMFCLSDVCKALELSNVTEVKKRLNEKGLSSIETLTKGGRQNLLYVNESNLYKTIFQSRKESAERFTDWVTSEVLPSIRKNGGYIAGQETLSDDELLEKAILVAQKKIAERDRIIAQQKEQIDEQKPLVDFAEHVSQSKDTIDMDEMAKIARDENIDIGRNRLIKWLKDKKILKDNRTPYQTFIDRGYFDVVEVKKATTYGKRVFLKTVVTGKGQIWVIEKLRAEYC